jgi:hypothetical protein
VDGEEAEVVVMAQVGLTKSFVNRGTVTSGVVGEGLAEDHPLHAEGGGGEHETEN